MNKLPAAARSMAHVAHMHCTSIPRAATAMLAPPAECDFFDPPFRGVCLGLAALAPRFSLLVSRHSKRPARAGEQPFCERMKERRGRLSNRPERPPKRAFVRADHRLVIRAGRGSIDLHRQARVRHAEPKRGRIMPC